MNSFLDKILQGIEVISVYLGAAIKIIETFLEFAPMVVFWVKDKMDEWQPKIDAGEIPGDEAREAIVAEGIEVFHGSGPVIEKGDFRTLVDQMHKIRKAARIGKDPYMDKEKLAVSKGYIKSEDLDRARKAMPYFQPLD